MLEVQGVAADYDRVSQEGAKRAELLRLAGVVIEVATSNFFVETFRPGYPLGVKVAEAVHSVHSDSMDEVMELKKMAEEARVLIARLASREQNISDSAAATRDQSLKRLDDDAAAQAFGAGVEDGRLAGS